MLLRFTFAVDITSDTVRVEAASCRVETRPCANTFVRDITPVEIELPTNSCAVEMLSAAIRDETVRVENWDTPPDGRATHWPKA